MDLILWHGKKLMKKKKPNKHLKPNGTLIDVTTICPHNCVYCYHQKEGLLDPVNMKADTFEAIISVLAKEGYKRVYLYMSGEPLAHPDIYRFIHRCGQEGFETNVATKAGIPINWPALIGAQMAFKKGGGALRWLIEVPTLKQETADHICSINLEKQKHNLQIFGGMARSRKYKGVSWRTVTIVTKWNEKELGKIKRSVFKVGFNSWVFKRPGYFLADDKESRDWMPSQLYNRRLISRRKKCPFPRNVAINVLGDVSVCCHDMLFRLNLGNVVKEGTLKGIINRNQGIMKRRFAMKLNICEKCN